MKMALFSIFRNLKLLHGTHMEDIWILIHRMNNEFKDEDGMNSKTGIGSDPPIA